MTAARTRTQYLTVEEKAAIVDAWISGDSIREAAQAVSPSCTARTAHKHIRAYQAQVAKELAKETEQIRAETYIRLQQVADEAMQDTILARDQGEKESVIKGFLEVRLKALAQIAKLAGVDAPAKIEHSGEVITEIRWVEEVADSEQS